MTHMVDTSANENSRKSKGLLTPKQVAEVLGVSTQWVLDHSNGRRAPQIPRVKLGRNVRFRLEDIDAFVKECRGVTAIQ